MKWGTNKLMARDAGGRFEGLSGRALQVQASYRIKLDARMQQQLAAAAERLKKNSVHSIKGVAYTLMVLAKASIVRTKKGKWGASSPGSPPHTRGIPRKSLKAAIYYDVDKQKGSAVIGPRHSFVAAVGELHEKGGTRRGKRGSRKYPKRPFMQPALERALPMIPAKFRSGLVGPGS